MARCLLTWHNYDLSGTVFSLRGGPLFVSDNYSNEIYVYYGMQAGVAGEKLSVAGSIDGLMLLTESELDFNERNAPEVKFALDYHMNNVRPGVKVIAPLDKDYLGRIVNYTYVLSLTWSSQQI